MAIRENLSNVKHKVRALVFAAAGLAAVIGGISQFAVAQEGSGLVAPIEGTWICTVTDDAGAYSFTALASFAAGGVALATGSQDRIHPASTLFGSWKHQIDGRYAVTRGFFVFDPASGSATGMLQNNENYQMTDRDHFAGTGALLACQVDGSNCSGPISNYAITCKRLGSQRE
jgi:hypothetical protein